MFETFLDWLHPALWLTWLAYWKISARGVKPAIRREAVWQRFSHYGPILIAAALFFFPVLPPPLEDRVFPRGLWSTYAIGTLVLTAGLLFAVWARVTLGRNWSAEVIVKENHDLIQNGPYRLVRHPIYTGMLFGFLGSAIAQDFVSSYLAVAIVFAGLWFKLRREEALMTETFGEQYQAYCAKTSRLVPYLV